uniref:Uncharacterized protein n=1 Tax=Lepeophtheirus salmonis TaxID=72036 RepID=A0A0K2UPK6_LEPSM
MLFFVRASLNMCHSAPFYYNLSIHFPHAVSCSWKI